MRGDHHRLVPEPFVTARQHADDIRSPDPVQPPVQAEAGADAQGNRCEVAALRQFRQCAQVMAGGSQQLACRRLGKPGSDFEARLAFVGKLEPRACQGRFDNLPGITCGSVGVNDDRARRPEPRGYLVLVGPAPVIQPALACEQVSVPVRIAVQHDQHLAGHVLALVIVPVVFRRLDAIADEDQFRIGQRRTVTLVGHARHEPR